MPKLYVYAAFDWLPSERLVGELQCDTVRGKETCGFAFDKAWLADYGDIVLSEDLHNFPGMQYPDADSDIFGCFSDALPDRWGRTLLNRREQIAASEEHRAVRRLGSYDYLRGIDDTSRMGAFRFAEEPGGAFINTDATLRVPPVASVRELMHAAHEIELSEQKHLLPSKKWLAQLLHPGTSLGGARPKASVIDDDGWLTVAKFPSRNDDYDVAGWEHFCHLMARKAGISVADTRRLPGDKYNILLSRRFDRTAEGRRVHFASALTMLGLADGDNASTGYGYPDIVDFIVRQGTDVELNLKELYRRVAFYIIVGNSDDHFRNHGFLLTRDGWTLSPAYDINPTLDMHQSLLINRTTDESNLETLQASAGEYMLTEAEAAAIIGHVKSSMRNWAAEARRLALPQREIDMFAPRFDSMI